MEFDHLKGFYYVAKLGSFTEAAERLYLTQPAISLQVKALESEAYANFRRPDEIILARFVKFTVQLNF